MIDVNNSLGLWHPVSVVPRTRTGPKPEAQNRRWEIDVQIPQESSGPMPCPLCKTAGKFELHDHRRVFYIECKNCVGFGISGDAIDHLTPEVQTLLSADARAAATDKHVLEITYRQGFQKEVVPRYRR